MASRQQKSPWFVPLLVIFVSLFLLLAARVLYQLLQPTPGKHDWTDFWLDWNAGIGVLCTILLAAVVATLPSRVESRIEAIAERMQSPLSSFDEVAERATKLLEGLGARSNTKFRYTSATPILGVELDESHREKWRRLLIARIEAGCLTEAVCLDPNAHDGQALSSLGEFCKVLAESYLKNKTQFSLMWDRARGFTEDFGQRFSSYSNFKMRLGGDPPFQLIIASDEEGFTKAVLYFASEETLRGDVKPSGFSTEDARMCEVLNRLFDHVTAEAVQNAKDKRTDLQRKRDAVLQSLRKEKDQEYDLEMDDVSKGFRLLVKPGVFPPEIEVVKKSFYGAIESAANLVWCDVDVEKRIGIDVGSGTGILALYLARYAPTVLATDIGAREIDNVKSNIARFNKLNPGNVTITALRTDLLERVDEYVGNLVPLIVFNHPFYPSPSNVFSVGGERAGSAIIQPFLEQARKILTSGGGVIMPYAALAGNHNPLVAATDLGFTSQLLSKGTDEEYGDHSIYLFTVASQRV